MIFNNSKRQMYFLLKDFNKTKDFKLSVSNMRNKFKLDEHNTSFRIYEIVTSHYIEGINCNKTMSNTYINTLSNHIFITYSGYEFLKDYYGFIKRIIWELFIIITTAIITVMANNKFSVSNQDINLCDDIISQCTSDIEVCNETN